MYEGRSWNWIEKTFKKIPIPYPIASLILAGVIYLIYGFLIAEVNLKVHLIEWDFYSRLQVSFTCVMIAYQLIGIQYLIDKMKKNFQKLESYPGGEKDLDDLCDRLENRMTGSNMYYAIIGLVFIPSIIIDLIRLFIFNDIIFFYSWEQSYWTFILDVYRYAIGYFALFLLAIVLWLMFNISWMINKIGSDPYRRFIKIDLFNIDKVGGLGQVRNFSLIVIAYYSIDISIAISTYVDKDGFGVYYYEILYLIALLLIGLGFFIVELEAIQKLFKGKMTSELDNLNEKYQTQYQKLIDIISDNCGRNDDIELNWVSTSLESLHNERDRILHATSRKAYHLTNVVAFISTTILPLITLFEKLNEYAITTRLVELFKAMILALLLPIFVSAVPNEANGIVTNVVDGDTFDVVIEKMDPGILYPIERIKLADLECPEISTPGGKSAKEFTAAILLNKTVWLDIDDLSEDGHDSCNRLVCVVYLTGPGDQPIPSPCFNRILADSGHAVIWDDDTNEFDPMSWWAN